ncbi:hypothetical protein U1Q18_014085, partial [Sarracenia purpurea var. burkii]
TCNFRDSEPIKEKILVLEKLATSATTFEDLSHLSGLATMAGNIPISLKLKSAAVHENSSDEEDAGIDLGLPLEKLNITGPRKKLLVLDLNGFLVHRVFCYDPKINDVRNNRRPDAIAGNFLVFNRPFCMEFLEFCFERFEVGLWSSARERNVDAILDTIKRGLKGKLLFVWDQAKCTDSGFKSLEKKDKPIFLKDLKKLLEVEDPSLPWRLGKFSSSNTLLIDDEPYKSLLNPVINLEIPSPRSPQSNP